MNEERMKLLEYLLYQTIDYTVACSRVNPDEKALFMHIEDYKKLYQPESYNQRTESYKNSYFLHINDESIKCQLLNFIRQELKPYVNHEDCIQYITGYLRTSYLVGKRYSYGLDELLLDILKIAVFFDVNRAVFAFQECLVNNEIGFQEIALLTGIEIDSDIPIFDGFKLIKTPLYSSDFQSLDYIPTSFHMTGDNASEFFSQRTLAVIDWVATPRFMKWNKSISPDDVAKSHRKNKELENFDLTEFLWALSLSCKHPIVSVMWWYNVDKWELLRNSPTSCRYSSGELSDTRPPYNVSEPEIKRATDYYMKFKDLRPDAQVKLRIAIPRWLKSKSEGAVNQAIDLGIAFEVIYLDETKEQLSYTFRTRAAWYLGEDPSKRKEYMNLFKKFYSYRSNAVHTGRIASAKKTRDANESKKIRSLLNDADKLCVASIIKVINDGGFPDWETLVLGR